MSAKIPQLAGAFSLISARAQAVKKFGTVVTVRRWVRGAPRRADVSFSTAEEMDAAISGLEGKERCRAELNSANMFDFCISFVVGNVKMRC